MEWDENSGAWVTYVRMLNGISTFGQAQSEALKHTREMILAYVETMSEDGLPLPFKPRELRSLRAALTRS